MNSYRIKIKFQKIIAALVLFTVFIIFDSHAHPSGSIGASFRTKPKIFFQFDTYRSFVSDMGASTFGFKAGVDFNNHIKFGIGYNTLSSDIYKIKIVTYSLPDSLPLQYITDTLSANLAMKSVPLLFEYIFYNVDPWQISVPLNIGLGKSYWWYYKQQSNKNGEFEVVNTEKKTVLLMTMNVDAQYKIVKWVGVGVGLGFRRMLIDNNIGENFNSVIGSIQLRLFLDEIYKSLFPKKN